MNERAVFLAALEFDSAQRATYLDGTCGADTPLRRRVERLLRAHAQADHFLTRPAFMPEAPTPSPDRSAGAEGGADATEPRGRVGPYEVLQRVGEGGMGVIYQARHVALNRLVALKMIQGGAGAGPQERARFRAEAEAAARLRHPHIVQIYEVGEWQGRPYLALEYMDRGSLAARLAGNPLPPHYAAELVELLARAVQAAHEQGIVHRDLKPSNVLLATPPPASSPVFALLGLPKVGDFGLAKRLGEDAGQTASGAILGTPSYMAPEQAEGKNREVGPAADTWALGAILYACLTGRPPFRADTLLETLEQVRSQEPVSPRRLRPDVPRDLVTVCLKALAKEPARRYASAGALADDLRRFLADEPVAARPVRPWECAWRWCRRNRAVAGLGAAVLLLVLVSVLGFGVASLVGGERDLAQANAARAEKAEGKAKALLTRAQEAEREVQIRAHLARAEVHRRSGQTGQRFRALAEIRLALRRNPAAELRQELRNEAVAALALPDLDPDGPSFPWPADAFGFDIEPTHTLYARTDRRGNCTVRRVADDRELHSIAGLGPSAVPILSPDGRFLAVRSFRTGAADSHRVCVWRIDGGRAAVVIPETRGRFPSFNRTVTRAVLADLDGTLTVYDLETGRVLHRLEPDTLKREVAHALHPTEPLVAVSSYFGLVVQVRDVRTGAVVVSLPQARGASGLAWHPDGHTLAACFTHAQEVRLYDRATWRLCQTLEQVGNGDTVTFNHAGDRLAVRGWSGMFELLDPGTGETLFRTRPGVAACSRFSRDDRWLVGGVEGGRFVAYRVGGGGEHRLFRHRPAADAAGPAARPGHNCAALHPDGRLLAVGLQEGLGFWDAATGKPLAFVAGLYAINVVAFESSGSLLTAAPGGLFRWPVRADAADPTHLRIGPPEKLFPKAMNLAQSRDGKVIAVVNRPTVAYQPYEGCWIFHRDRPGPPLRIAAGEDLLYVAVSPDGRWVVTTNHETGRVRVWAARDGRPVKTLAEWGGGRPSFSPDGRWLSTGLDGGRLYAVGTWEPGRRVGGSGVFSPDGKFLAIETAGPLRLVEAATGRECATLAGPYRERMVAPTFAPDGARLLGVLEGQGVVVWDSRALRRGLADLGLDWDGPPYPPAKEAGAGVARLTVTVNPGPYFSPADALTALASRQQGEQNFGSALKALREAVAADPKHARAQNNLAWLLLTGPPGLRDPAAALPLARRAAELVPDAASYHNTLGVALYRAGDYAEAVKELGRSLKDGKGQTDAFDLYFLAMCHQRLGDAGKARECFDRAVRWVAERQARLSAGWREELTAFRAEAEALLAGSGKGVK